MIVDTFTYIVVVVFFPKQVVTAIAEADALWRHTCRFTEPLQNSSLTLGHSLSTTYLYTSTTRPLSNLIPQYRTLRKRMAQLNKQTKKSIDTYGTFFSTLHSLKLVTVTVYDRTGAQQFRGTITQGFTKYITIVVFPP